jgi:predicted porin
MNQRRKIARDIVAPLIVLVCQSAVVNTAQAQSSVSLYGIVDGSILYTSHTLNTKTGGDSGSRVAFADSGSFPTVFGMRGSEDLGGGVRALFNLESGVSIANGALAHSNGNLFGRRAWVGIDSAYGVVKAGVQFSPFFQSLFALDPRDGSFFGSGFVNYADNVSVTGVFNANSITYTSPEIAGLQTTGMIAIGGLAGNFQAGRQYSANLNYHLGGLLVSAAMYNGNAADGAATTPVPTTTPFAGRMLGASYRFPNELTVKASYALYKVTGSFDSQVYSGGASYGLTSSVSIDAGVWYTRDGNDSANHSILVGSGVSMALSKQTSLYGQVGYVDNHGHMNTGLSVSNALYGVSGSTVGVTLGLRHLF